MWAEKARLANGHPFSAAEDIYKAALDAIWGVTFPFDPKDSIINSQLEVFSSMPDMGNALPANINEPVIFPEVLTPPAQESILALTESLEKIVMSPMPRLIFKLLSLLPYMRQARATKEKMIASEIMKAKQRFTEERKEKQVARCAMDDIVYREFVAAKKENRDPVYDTRTIFDEVSLSITSYFSLY